MKCDGFLARAEFSPFTGRLVYTRSSSTIPLCTARFEPWRRCLCGSVWPCVCTGACVILCLCVYVRLSASYSRGMQCHRDELVCRRDVRCQLQPSHASYRTPEHDRLESQLDVHRPGLRLPAFLRHLADQYGVFCHLRHFPAEQAQGLPALRGARSHLWRHVGSS